MVVCYVFIILAAVTSFKFQTGAPLGTPYKGPMRVRIVELYSRQGLDCAVIY